MQGNLIEMNTSLKKDLDSQKTNTAETKKVSDHKLERKYTPKTLDTAHVESSTMDTEFKSNTSAVKQKV